MAGRQYTHTGSYSTGNPATTRNGAINVPAFPPHWTGSVFLLPQPPCAPAPVNVQQIANVQADTPNFAEYEAGVPSQQSMNADHDRKVKEFHEKFANNLTLAPNESFFRGGECIARPSSAIDYAGPGPYSMILPPGSLIQPYSQSVPASLYSHFSPVLPATMPQVHPIYPVDMMSAQDSVRSNTGYIPVRPASAPDYPIRSIHPPRINTQDDHAANVSDAPWAGCFSMASNPPVYWGHYVASDNTHGVALTSQQFIRRHSVVEDSSVVTPTNVCQPCNFAAIVSATPEFIHPRKPDVPQWLMSPPVGEQDPSIISYAPMLYHNVRIPSVTGIAIPVVGPVGAAVPTTSHGVNYIEPPKILSPPLVLSTPKCYEVGPSAQPMGCIEPRLLPETAHESALTSSTATSCEQQFLLMIPDDFLPSTAASKMGVMGDGLPSDFNTARSVITSRQYVHSKSDACTTTRQSEELENKEKLFVSPKKNVKASRKRFSDINDTISKNSKRASKTCNSSSIKQVSTLNVKGNNQTENSRVSMKVEASTQTPRMSIRDHKHDMSSLLYSYLRSATVNLSAACATMCRWKSSRVKRHCSHKKHALSRNCCSCFVPLCSCLRKQIHASSICNSQQTQSWDSSGCNAIADPKLPTPDLFNRWPNIPLPPTPVPEDDDCLSTCSGTDLCPGALPLAAALFHNEPIECCHGNMQEEESSSYPIGVFWDIENCAVPSGKSSLSIVQRVRERFFAGHKEAEFMCVCDINKESRHVIQDLNNAQVNVVHINATAKNAADDKLRQSIRRFAHNHPAPATLVLITGDCNFTSEVSDLRHRHKYFVVLIHPAHANQALKQAATTIICYEQLVADLPVVHVSPKTTPDSPSPQLLVTNLPLNNDANAIRGRLHQLSENCGGKVAKLSMGTAILKFVTTDAANRALKRLEGENVYGHIIHVTLPKPSPVGNGRNFTNTPGFSPKRNFEGPCRQKMRDEPVRNTFIPASSDAACQIITTPPSNCIPSVNIRTGFPPFAPPILGPPPFSLYPSLPAYMASGPSPNMPQSGYNSMPLPPQPQVFHPPAQNSTSKSDVQEGAVKLTISNIDAQLGVNAIQDVIFNQISGICRILGMKVRPHNRFTVVCDVTVPHVQDASRVLQHLQRQKIGSKRVLVTLAQQNWDEFGSDEAACLKRDCFIILKEAPEKRMPLYRFFNLYMKRFQRKIELDELHQIPDIVHFQDGPFEREICLNPKIKDQQSLEQYLSNNTRTVNGTPDINHDFLLPVCKLHYPTDTQRPPPSEKERGLLKIEMGLREFSAKLHALLLSHNGILQLDGFEYCYCAEYGTFPFPKDLEGGGVIVEHQACYVPGVQIITSQPHCLGVKAIVWAQPQSDTGSDSASDTSGATRWKSPNLIHFSREVVDLLKEKPYSCLPYDNFGSSYQLYFGHACRPSDYGFTRISELIAAIPHVLQIMGSLTNRILTLTHRAQVKRFTHEVVKILKSTPDRAILVAQMPELYNGTFSRVWRLRDYGVSVLSDLLDDIPDGHICATGEGDNIVLSLPIRERSAEEKERTGQFGREVVKILRGRPHYQMPFTDFVPAYHRQFGRQCKLSNYGFSKLVDLFEALPHIVQVIEKGTEKFLALADVEQQKILSIQIASILRAQIPPSVPLISVHSMESSRNNATQSPTLPLACIPALFQQKYGFPLIPQELNSVDLDDLIRKLSHAVKVVVNQSGDKMVHLAERKPIRLLSARLLALLLDQPADQLDIELLHTMYMERYKESIEPNEYGFLSFCDIIRKALPGVVKMDLDAPECLIHLKPLYKEARDIRSVLLKSNGTMTMGEFNFGYLTTFHRPVDCEKLGFPTFESLLRALPNVLIVKGFGAKRTLTLRNHMQFGPLTAASMTERTNDNTVRGSASLDDLQALEGSRPRQSAWMPKPPLCMMPYWNVGEQSKALLNSSSAGNLGNAASGRIEKLRPAVSRPAPSWTSPYKKVLPPAPVMNNSRVTKARASHLRPSPTTFEKCTPLTTCTFTIGEIPNPQDDQTPVRRGVSTSVITLPNGSTPIASTSSSSSASTPNSVRSSDEYSDGSCSSEENGQSPNRDFCSEFSSLNKTGVSSLPNSPFARIPAAAFVGSLASMRSVHPASDHRSPARIQLAASFPSLTRT